MHYVNLGSTGLKVSRICLGMMTYGTKQWRPWIIEEDQARPIIRAAFDRGVNFFDTADMYSLGVSEEILGRAVADFGRQQVVVATKLYFPVGEGPNDRGLSRRHVMEAIDASLRRLGTDYVDLYQIHRFDRDTPVEETMQALNDVVRSGKARYIGASSMYAWQFAKMQAAAERNGWTKFVSMQNHYNLIYREEEREMIPLCLDQGVGVLPWSPLARGFLAGNRSRADRWGDTLRGKTDDYARKLYEEDSDFDVADRLLEVANVRSLQPAQIALAWLLHKRGVTAPIVGASQMQHLDDALSAVEVQLSEDEIARLEQPYRPHPILGHD